MEDVISPRTPDSAVYVILSFVIQTHDEYDSNK